MGPPDFVLTNARVLTMDEQRPRAGAVAVKDGRILWLGSMAQLTASGWWNVRNFDCAGGSLLPGFHDAHIHLLSYASTALAVDCRPASVSSIRDIKREIGERASRTPQGEWIRAWGYDETSLEDRRHPTRRDLDDTTQHHPVRLDHRSGHASVLNSLALERVGIGDSFSEPPGATVERELDTGRPSGALLEMQSFLEGKTNSHTSDELESSIKAVAGSLLEQGVTSVQDATPYNSVSGGTTLQTLANVLEQCRELLSCRDIGTLLSLWRRSLTFGSGTPVLRAGHAKIMVTASSGRLTPDKRELSHMVRECAEAGLPSRDSRGRGGGRQERG